jgi:hypothetical protein
MLETATKPVRGLLAAGNQYIHVAGGYGTRDNS